MSEHDFEHDAVSSRRYKENFDDAVEQLNALDANIKLILNEYKQLRLDFLNLADHRAVDVVAVMERTNAFLGRVEG